MWVGQEKRRRGQGKSEEKRGGKGKVPEMGERGLWMEKWVEAHRGEGHHERPSRRLVSARPQAVHRSALSVPPTAHPVRAPPVPSEPIRATSTTNSTSITSATSGTS